MSPWAPSPIKKHDGYFIVSLEPRFPSSHSMCASLVHERPLRDQVVHVVGPVLDRRVPELARPGLTMISITPEWNESVEYTGAVQPSM